MASILVGMKIATLIYKRLLAEEGVKRRCWSLIRKTAIAVLRDPDCTLTIHGKVLSLPLSHDGPRYVNEFRFYNDLPRRLGEYVREKYGGLWCVDVGANIGDTVAAFHATDEDAILAIEPHPRFNHLLRTNWGWNERVKIVAEICARCNDEEVVTILERKGTASVLQTAEGSKKRRRKLDDIVGEWLFADRLNVLKVDTDGYDIDVLFGAMCVIGARTPAILFECDAFGNTRHVEDCLDLLRDLHRHGYAQFLLYDNTGHLMGKHALSDLAHFRNLLFHQAISRDYYFDILLMKDDDVSQFHGREIRFFVDQMPNKSMQANASRAMKI